MDKLSTWKEEAKKLDQCNQWQDSVVDQMCDLYDVANKLGMYDAADYIKAYFIKYRNTYSLKK